MIAKKLKTPIKIRKLQRALYTASKEDPQRTFYSLYDKIYRKDILTEAYERVRSNGGGSGVDDMSWESIDKDLILKEIHGELKNRKYKPEKLRRIYIPKKDKTMRPLSIPTIKDRIVQTALQIVIEPIFEAGFYEHSYGFRPQRNAHQMVNAACRALNSKYTICIDADIKQIFDNVNHQFLIKSISRKIKDGKILKLIKSFLVTPIKDENKVTVPTKGCAQGGPISPLLANIYLTALDYYMYKNTRMKNCIFFRYCDDILLLCREGHDKEGAKKLKEGLKWLKLEINFAKSKKVDMSHPSKRVTILGFDIIRYKSGVLATLPSQTAIQKIKDKVKTIVRKNNPNPIKIILQEVTRATRGWCNYFSLSSYSNPFKKIGLFTMLRIRKLLLRRSKYRTWKRNKYNFKWINKTFNFEDAYILWIKARKLV